MQSRLGKIVLVLCGLLDIAGTPAWAELPKSMPEAQAIEERELRGSSSFYDVASPLPPGSPGTLIRSELARDYDTPAGVSAVRILYHSRNALNRDVAASAVILTPPGEAPKGGWRIIVWAHGTTGVAQQCAPSLSKNIPYGKEVLYPMLKAGFAVVAVDYAGLGTTGPHQYHTLTAQARDIINAVPAARAAIPQLGTDWVVDGHSEGAYAAWGVAEEEAKQTDPGYLGAISVAGATNLKPFLRHLNSSSVTGFYVRYFIYGIHARFPQFDPRSVLTKAAMRKYETVTTNGCWYYAYAAGLDEKGPWLKPGWENNVWVKRWIAENSPGDRPVQGPLLVIAGDDDKTQPLDGLRASVAKVCRPGSAVELRSYPGLDHSPVMYHSLPDQLDWISARFNRQSSSTDCQGT